MTQNVTFAQDEDGYWTGYRTWTEELWKALGVDGVTLGEAEKTITDVCS